MAAANVKCLYCGKTFDRNSISCVKIGRRYAHQECADKIQKGQQVQTIDPKNDQREFHDFVSDLYNKHCNWPLIQKQEKEYLENGLTYSGMKKTLYWWYQTLGHTIESSNGGIGIIPYVYKQAEQYYYNLYIIENKNKDIVKTETQTLEVKIKEPQAVLKQPKFFDIGE